MSEDHDDSDASLNNSQNSAQLNNGTFGRTQSSGGLQGYNRRLQTNGGHLKTKESKVKRSWSKSTASESTDSDASLNNSMSTALAGLLCHSHSSSSLLSLQTNQPNETLGVTSSGVMRLGTEYESSASNHYETVNDEVHPDLENDGHCRPKLFKFSLNSPELFGTTESQKDEKSDEQARAPIGQYYSNIPAVDVDSNMTTGGVPPRRKLVLHFDIRNTILVADSVTQVNIEQALNTFLTGVTWGTDDKEWRWCSNQPSLTPPLNHPEGAMTYYKRLEKVLVRTPSDRALLRQATGDFTSMPIGAKFRPYFDKHLKLLEWIYLDPQGDLSGSNLDRPESILSKTSSDSMLTISGSDGRLYHYILPSFIHMIYALQAAGRDFSIILRTFGMDASNVLAATQRCIDGHHPGYRHPLPIKVHDIPGHIHRSSDGRISLDVAQDNSRNRETFNSVIDQAEALSIPGIKDSRTSKLSTDPMTSSYSTERQIYEHLSQTKGISGYVDDFRYWQDDDYNHKSGKPLWIDLSDNRVHHILFDDNIRVKDVDSIVDVRVFDGSAPTSLCQSLALDKIVKFENVCMVQADLLESTGNMDYFLDKIKMCETKYDTIFGQGASEWGDTGRRDKGRKDTGPGDTGLQRFTTSSDS